MEFIGFRSYVKENSAGTRTFLGYATVVVPKGMCEQNAHFNGPNVGAMHFDNGTWMINCAVSKVIETGEIQIDLPCRAPTGYGHNRWYYLVKMSKEHRDQLTAFIISHIPAGDDIPF